MEGKCHICGNIRKLSFEHVPPKSAFNDRQVIYHHIIELLSKSLNELGKGKISQKGMGGYTLCEICNNNTGRWYGEAFSDFAFQGMNILRYTNSNPSLFYNFNIFPQRVFKQILCLFFSANGPNFQEKHLNLVKYILNKEQSYYDSDARIFIYYNLSKRLRNTGLAILANNAEEMKVVSEVTFPPFGYVMTLNNYIPDPRLTEITFFKNYNFNNWTQIPLKMKLLPVNSYFPIDYRSKEEIDKDLRRVDGK